MQWRKMGKQSSGPGNSMACESAWASKGPRGTHETNRAPLCKPQELSGGRGVTEFGGNGTKPGQEEPCWGELVMRMLRLREVDWPSQGHTASVFV